MCHVCGLSLVCLFIISGGFDALHQLSVKKILWKYSIQSLKTADAVHSCEIMADATFFTPPSPELGATLFSNKRWTLHSQRTSKCIISTLYRLGPPHGHSDSCFLCYFYIFFFLSSSYMYILYVPRHAKMFFGNGRPGVFQTSLVSRKSGWTVSSAPLVFAYVIRHAFAWPGLYRDWNSHKFPTFSA